MRYRIAVALTTDFRFVGQFRNITVSRLPKITVTFKHARFGILTTVIKKFTVSQDVFSCSLIVIYRCVRRKLLPSSSVQKMVTTGNSETSTHIYQAARRHSPKDKFVYGDIIKLDTIQTVSSTDIFTGVLISPQPHLLPDVFCLVVRIFRLMLVLLYTGCPRRNVQYFGRVFLMLKYTDITQNTYIQS